MNEPASGRHTAGWILAGLLALVFVGSGVAKLVGPEPVRESLAKWGLADMRIVIGIGECLSAILFLVPRTSPLGVLLLSAYMGGAIATHMGHGESFLPASFVLILVWIAAYVRNPEMFQRLTING